jgi:hypothetical protein
MPRRSTVCVRGSVPARIRRRAEEQAEAWEEGWVLLQAGLQQRLNTEQRVLVAPLLCFAVFKRILHALDRWLVRPSPQHTVAWAVQWSLVHWGAAVGQVPLEIPSPLAIYCERLGSFEPAHEDGIALHQRAVAQLLPLATQSSFAVGSSLDLLSDTTAALHALLRAEAEQSACVPGKRSKRSVTGVPHSAAR